MKGVYTFIFAFALFQFAFQLELGESIIKTLKTNSQISNSSCIQGILESIIFKNDKTLLINFILDSSKSLNDIGDYEACNPHEGNSSYFTFYPEGPVIGFAEGLCLPKECTLQDLDFLRSSALTIFQDAIKGLNRGNMIYRFNLTINDIYIIDPRSDINHLNITNPLVLITLSIITLIIVINILSFNISDQENLQKSSAGIFDFLMISFNPSINFSKLLEEEKSTHISAIHGLKTILLIWILFCSSFWNSLNGLVNDTFLLYEFLQNSANSFIYFGYFSIDCLFLLSGIITMHEIEKCLEAVKNAPPIKFLIKKFITFISMMIFIYLLNRFVAPLLIDGPFAFKTLNMFSGGYINDFFMDIFLLGNYIPSNLSVSCWSWLVATEFQFFIISLLLLYFLKRNKTIIIFVTLGLIAGSLVATGIISNINDIKLTSFKFSNSFVNMYLTKPWTWFTPYGIGIIFYFIFISNKSENESNENSFFSLLKSTLMQVICPAVSIVCLVLFFYIISLNNKNEMGSFDFICLIFAGPILSIILFLLILPYIVGAINPFKIVFANNFTNVVSKFLIFTLLISEPVFRLYYNNLKIGFYFETQYFVLGIWFFLIMSLGLAFLFTGIYLYPIIVMTINQEIEIPKFKSVDEENQNLIINQEESKSFSGSSIILKEGQITEEKS